MCEFKGVGRVNEGQRTKESVVGCALNWMGMGFWESCLETKLMTLVSCMRMHVQLLKL